jgi:hypothetical protein
VTGFLAAARRDGTLRRTAVAAALLAAVFRFLWKEPWTVTVSLVAAGTFASLATDYADHRGTPTAVRHLGFGGALVAVTGGWWALAGADSAPPSLAAVGFVAGAWLLLDGWTARRAGHPDAGEPPAGDTTDELSELAEGGIAAEFRSFRNLGAVGRAIDDGATTPEAIAAELDRTVASVEDDLDVLETAGAVEPVSDDDPAPAEQRKDSDDAGGQRRYRLTDREWSAPASVVSWPRRLLARLLRPARLVAADGR